MIGSIRGTVVQSDTNSCLVETTNGVGYLIYVTPDTAADLFNQEDSQVFFYVYTVVKEDALDLYGFARLDEKRLFEQIISVSGIGPKSGLAILSVAPINQLKAAIASGDSGFLTNVSGVGKKSAQKIILELQDKLAKESIALDAADKTYTTDSEVLSALVSLGYSETESRKAIKNIDSEIKGTEARLMAALRQVS